MATSPPGNIFSPPIALTCALPLPRFCVAAQVRAIGGEKMFPGGLVAIGARSGQGEIFKMQSAQVFLELLRRYRSCGQRFLCAALEHGSESFAQDFPAASL